MKILLNILTLFIFLNNISKIISESDDFNVELVQVLFRHGDRAASEPEIYKTDPYDEIYKKHGYGQLTKIGMQRMYKLGQILRERYNDFLGEVDTEFIHQVYARSTDYDRTKMSLQLVLAGLYRPTNETSWNNNILWTPIPTHYEKRDFDIFMTSDACPRYRPLLSEAENSPEIMERIEKYTEFYEYIKSKTLLNLKRPFDMYLIYNNLQCALSLGLPLPDWCSEEYLKIIDDIQNISYDAMVHTETLRRMMVGPTIDQFLKNIEDSSNPENKKKIYLYCAHDINIATFTKVHNFTNSLENPDFGSGIVFEKLRGRDNQIYIRMALWPGHGEQFIPLKLKDCDNECPLEKYMDLVSELLPDDETKKCTALEKICDNQNDIDKLKFF